MAATKVRASGSTALGQLMQRGAQLDTRLDVFNMQEKHLSELKETVPEGYEILAPPHGLAAFALCEGTLLKIEVVRCLYRDLSLAGPTWVACFTSVLFFTSFSPIADEKNNIKAVFRWLMRRAEIRDAFASVFHCARRAEVLLQDTDIEQVNFDLVMDADDLAWGAAHRTVTMSNGAALLNNDARLDLWVRVKRWVRFPEAPIEAVRERAHAVIAASELGGWCAVYALVTFGRCE